MEPKFGPYAWVKKIFQGWNNLRAPPVIYRLVVMFSSVSLAHVSFNGFIFFPYFSWLALAFICSKEIKYIIKLIISFITLKE